MARYLREADAEIEWRAKTYEYPSDESNRWITRSLSELWNDRDMDIGSVSRRTRDCRRNFR